MQKLWITVQVATGLSLLTATSLWAQENQRIYRSAYFLGRGDTGTAIADDEDAIFYNPAGIAYGKGIYKETILVSPMVEISQDTRNLAREVALENSSDTQTLREHVGKPQHIGIYNFTGIIFRRAAFGLISSGRTDILISKAADFSALERIDASAFANAGATFTLAQDFFDGRFLIGTTGKYLYRGQAQVGASILEAQELQGLSSTNILQYGTGAGADIGLMFRGGGRIDPSLGITVQNVGQTHFSAENGGTRPDPLRQSVNIGAAVSPGTQFSTFRLLADLYDIADSEETDFYTKLHLGAEISIRNIVGFTGGVNEGYGTGGFYLDLHVLRLDLGGYTEEVGDKAGSRPDRRYYARLTVAI